MSEDNALRTLATLLQAGGARPDVDIRRLAPSAVYDLHYRLFIIAAAFEIHADPYLLGQRRIASARLKLFQFVAIRPWLLEIMRQWSETQKNAQQSILLPQQLRRGFLGDETHDRVIAFLVARGAFECVDKHIISRASQDALKRIHAAGVEQHLFSHAIRTLNQLKEIKITNSMLEGW